MTRHGALLVFKPGLDPAAAATALKSLEAVLDPDYFHEWPSKTRTTVLSSGGTQVLTYIEAFDDAQGGPVFYIP